VIIKIFNNRKEDKIMDNLGVRMKEYEKVETKFLTRRIPTIIRLDGKAFHSFTKGFDRPFDNLLMKTMQETTQELCKQIQGCKMAYTQSDEISLLLTDYDKITTSAWFDKNIQKMVSVSASMTTLIFNNIFRDKVEDVINTDEYIRYMKKVNTAMFDSRVFNLPKEEVCNYFIWRQQDATRNAIQMAGQVNFSHKELQGINCNKIQDKLFIEKGINFNDLPIIQKRGTCITKKEVSVNDTIRKKWIIDKEIPIFTSDRSYIERYL
jgi:tRNA(His) guanylyltransferase